MTLAKHKDVYELTPAQRAILLYTQSAPASPAYFDQICYASHGPLDVTAFKQAWQRVTDRHPSLRTSIYCEAGERPVQVVERKLDLPLVEHDWRGLSATTQTQRLRQFLEADRKRGFDLAAAPLLRLALIRLDEESYHFVLSSHQIIMDSWSMSLVRSEVSRFYKAGKCETAVSLERARGFGDYVDWLCEQSDEDSDRFWELELSGFVAPNNLAIDRTPDGPPPGDLMFAQSETELPGWLTSDLQSFAGSIRLTMSTLIQGVWAVLLSRYCRTDDVVFGFSGAGRPPGLAGAESMVGCFTNLQPRRVLISQSDSILSYFKSLQSAVARQREHEHCSLDRIKSLSEAPPSLPLCETLVVFENFQAATAPLVLGTPMVVTGAHLMRTSYPLVLVAHPGNQLRLQMIYHGHHFAAEAIERLLGNLAMMLEDMVENPSRSIGSLELLHALELTNFGKWNAQSSGPARTRPDRGLRLLPPERRVG